MNSHSYTSRFFLWVFWLTRSLAGYNRDESEGEGPRLLRLAEHLKFGSLGESAKHFLAFRPQPRGYVSGVFVSVGREMIFLSDFQSKLSPVVLQADS